MSPLLPSLDLKVVFRSAELHVASGFRCLEHPSQCSLSPVFGSWAADRQTWPQRRRSVWRIEFAARPRRGAGLLERLLLRCGTSIRCRPMAIRHTHIHAQLCCECTVLHGLPSGLHHGAQGPIPQQGGPRLTLCCTLSQVDLLDTIEFRSLECLNSKPDKPASNAIKQASNGRSFILK